MLVFSEDNYLFNPFLRKRIRKDTCLFLMKHFEI